MSFSQLIEEDRKIRFTTTEEERKIIRERLESHRNKESVNGRERLLDNSDPKVNLLFISNSPLTQINKLEVKKW
jgi:hypothetical protein